MGRGGEASGLCGILALNGDIAPGAESLGHCLSHGRLHIERFRRTQPARRTQGVVPKFPLSLTNHNESEQNMIKQLRAAAAIAILACAGVAAAQAQEVTQAEKEKTLQYLEKTKQGVLDA